MQAWRLRDDGTLLKVVDPTMNIRGYEDEVERVLNIALLCVQSTGQSRPCMARVVSMLKGEIEPEPVMRQSQFNRPEYDSFLAAAAAQSTGSNFTMSTIAERSDEHVVELDDDKPLLVLDPHETSAGSTELTSSSLFGSSGRVELTSSSPFGSSGRVELTSIRLQ